MGHRLASLASAPWGDSYRSEWQLAVQSRVRSCSRIDGSRIIAPQRSNSAHLHRPWRASFFLILKHDVQTQPRGFSSGSFAQVSNWAKFLDARSNWRSQRRSVQSIREKVARAGSSLREPLNPNMPHDCFAPTALKGPNWRFDQFSRSR